MNIALGSLAEVKYLLRFARRLGYLPEAAHEPLAGKAETLGKCLWRFYRAIGGPDGGKG